MSQELINPRVSNSNSVRTNGPEDAPSQCGPLSQTTDNAQTFYLRSILQVPDSQSFRRLPDFSSLTKTMVDGERHNIRISDFPNLSIQARNPLSYIKSPEPMSTLYINPVISHLGQQAKETQSKKSSGQQTFQPLARSPLLDKSDKLEHLEEIDVDFLDDFDCSMENFDPESELQTFEGLEAPLITFASVNLCSLAQEEARKIVSLRQFVEKLQSRNQNSKIYICDICGKSFSNHAALGGHKAKNHPHSSKTFIERKKTFELRKSERKKREFLRNF